MAEGGGGGPRAVLFDNDGLLLDTESAWSRAEGVLFDRRGIEFTIEHKRRLVGSSAEIAGATMAGFFSEPGRDAEIIAELNELVMLELEGGVDAMVGARELIGCLRARGVPLGLVSNSPLPFIRRSHEMAGTGMPFDVVISGHEVAAPKPAPDPYLEACRELGQEPGPGVVALEDSPSGVASASAAGLYVVGVPSVEGIELERADLVVESLEDERLLSRLGLAGAGGGSGA